MGVGVCGVGWRVEGGLGEGRGGSLGEDRHGSR